MARSLSDSPILNQLRTAKSYSEQASALKALKNEVVGHVQRKEAWIKLGVLEPIARTLSVNLSSPKPSSKDAHAQFVVGPLSDADAVKQQALQLVASFASGGPSFLDPIHAARLIPAALANLSPFTNPPQLVLAALKSLSAIANSSALAPPPSSVHSNVIADSLFVSPHLESFNAILSISSTNYILQSQVHLTACLISGLCKEEKHQSALATVGVLDSLGARLASFAVRDGFAIPGAKSMAEEDGFGDTFPVAAPSGARLGPILDAIGAIIGNSQFRANRLTYSPAMLAVFPPAKFDMINKGLHDPNPDLIYGNAAMPQQPTYTAMDYMLPPVPLLPRNIGAQSSLSLYDRYELHSTSRSSQNKSPWSSSRVQLQPEEDDLGAVESPLVPWLIHLMRSRTGYDRLMAAYVLTELWRAGLGNKHSRETSLGLFAVPVLLDMISQHDQEDEVREEPQVFLQRIILERAPAILARLITDNETLQKAAYDAGAVKIVVSLLKVAYQPVQPSIQQFWSPQPDDASMDVESSAPLSQLGSPGQDPLLVHRIKVRESALKAIGALAAAKDEYRKDLVKEGVVPYVLESLCEFPRKARLQARDRPKDVTDETDRSGPTQGYGTNTVPVLIAACYVVRLLARSVSILRTALVDHCVALPVLRYMSHPDVNVQIAAATAMINLVLDFSPLQELLTEHGVMAVLCEKVHSDNIALRLNSLWALKHLVENLASDEKKSFLERMGRDWLLHLIGSDDAPDNSAFGRGGSDAEDADEDMESQALDERLRWLQGMNGVFRELDTSRSTRLRQVESRLSAIRDTELTPARWAFNDKLAIEEQALNLVRNLIGRPSSPEETPDETTEMIDHLFAEIGQAPFFEILTSKLRPRLLSSHPRAGSNVGTERRMLHPSSKIIVAVILILVHMAASVQRHKQLLVRQTELLKLLVQQCSSKARDVRLSICHLLINLTLPDDDADRQFCAIRAHELRTLGFHSKVESMKTHDRDLDIRERAKTAAWQIERASGGF
ncbi:armadillo repeat protein [Stachybotrys elegans]|uniref:Armadillo repeat protein n=1 Tax=Stachybotrys elegans TaxID=80388 RepID=A0A8K0SY45_9HYPO|nr:armadillo repeat protein [Stachybotrys elegans]